MKKYINPTTEVMSVKTMMALCDGSGEVGQANNPNHAPRRIEID